MIGYILIGLGVAYRIYSRYFKAPKCRHPNFSSKINTSRLTKFHAIKRPFLTSKNDLTDVLEQPTEKIGLYKIYTHIPGKRSDNVTNEGVVLQIKDPSFNFGKEICVTRDINDDYRSKFFVIVILPILFLSPFLLISLSQGQQSIYSITTRHEIYYIPMRLFRTIGILVFSYGLKYFYSRSYTENRVILENKEFEKLLDVFSESGVHARVLFTPERMEICNTYFAKQKLPTQNLLYTSSSSRNTQSLIFVDDSIYIYCTNPRYTTQENISFKNQELLHHIKEIKTLISELRFLTY